MVVQKMLEFALIESLGKFPLVFLHMDLLFLFFLLNELLLDHPDGCIDGNRSKGEENDSHVENGPSGNFIGQSIDGGVLHHTEQGENYEEGQDLQPD